MSQPLMVQKQNLEYSVRRNDLHNEILTVVRLQFLPAWSATPLVNVLRWGSFSFRPRLVKCFGQRNRNNGPASVALTHLPTSGFAGRLLLQNHVLYILQSEVARDPSGPNRDLVVL